MHDVFPNTPSDWSHVAPSRRTIDHLNENDRTGATAFIDRRFRRVALLCASRDAAHAGRTRVEKLRVQLARRASCLRGLCRAGKSRIVAGRPALRYGEGAAVTEPGAAASPGLFQLMSITN